MQKSAERKRRLRKRASSKFWKGKLPFFFMENLTSKFYLLRRYTSNLNPNQILRRQIISKFFLFCQNFPSLPNLTIPLPARRLSKIPKTAASFTPCRRSCAQAAANSRGAAIVTRRVAAIYIRAKTPALLFIFFPFGAAAPSKFDFSCQIFNNFF